MSPKTRGQKAAAREAREARAPDSKMECAICLSEFQADFALIPELDCNCIVVVHEECWDQWSGLCLYCRNTAIELGPMPMIRTRSMYNPLNTTAWVGIIAIILILYINIILIKEPHKGIDDL